MENILETIIGYCVSLGGKLLLAGIVLGIGLPASGMLIKKLRKGKMAPRMDRTVASFYFNFVNILAKIIIVVTAIAILGVPMASIVTVLAAAGAAIGLAMQGSLSNLAGGLMLAIFKPFRVDDYVESQGVSGTVEEISIMYTVLRTPDNKKVTLPNGTLLDSTITNYSAKDTRRVDFTFSVSYESDIDRVREVITSIATAHPLVLKDQPVTVALAKQNQSSLDFVLRVWSKNGDYWTVFYEINETVKKAFDKTGIRIPYPQMDVHIKE